MHCSMHFSLISFTALLLFFLSEAFVMHIRVCKKTIRNPVIRVNDREIVVFQEQIEIF